MSTFEMPEWIGIVVLVVLNIIVGAKVLRNRFGRSVGVASGNMGDERCQECGGETYITGGDVDYDNRWCTACEWFAEIEVEEAGV